MRVCGCSGVLIPGKYGILGDMTKLQLGIFSAIALAGMAVVVVMQQQSVVRLRAENQSLQRQQDQIAQLAAENERLSNSVNQATNPGGLSPDQSRELLRLRGEVGTLRQKAKELVRVQEENRELRARPMVNQTPVAVESRRVALPEEEARNLCINNLRQIDGAIQQCALENKLTTNDVVTVKQLEPYLARIKDVLRCPSGGTYTFGPVTELPACSIPGHALPTQ
jgi:hypothetical protein